MLSLHGVSHLSSDELTRVRVENWTATEVRGGTPILLVHGGPGLFGYMGDLAEELGKSWPTWTYFQRGKAFSETSGEITVATHINDLKCVVESLPAKPVIVGHSWGAMLSALAMREFPWLARRLVMVGPMPFDAAGMGLFAERILQRLTQAERNQRAENMHRLARQKDYALKNALFRVMSEASFKAYQRHPTVDLLSSKVDGYDVESFFGTHADLAGKMANTDFLATLRDFPSRVDMIYGDFDPSPCARLADQLKAVLPELRVTSIAECGHYPWWEAENVRKVFFAAMAEALREDEVSDRFEKM